MKNNRKLEYAGTYEASFKWVGKTKDYSTGKKNVGGQMSFFNKGQAKKWVGACLPCPPSSYAPDMNECLKVRYT